MTHGLLALACRAFPREHRARRSDEIIDTAILASGSSRTRAAREALSLFVAGARQRIRAESHRSLRDGAALLAGVLAVVNLAVALAGITSGFGTYSGPSVLLWGLRYGRLSVPFIIDGWWITFTVAAAVLVYGLARGHRWLAVGAAMANLGLVAYDALLANGYPDDGKGHLDVFTNLHSASFPGGRQWLLVAIVLAVATTAARPRGLPLTRLPLVLVAVSILVWLSRETWGWFFFLRWPIAVIILLGLAFGAVAPRLAVLALGVTLVAVPSVVVYLTTSASHSAYGRTTVLHHDPVVTGVVVAGLALGALVPLAQLTHRRLD